jgi:hypothetical protein
MSGEGGASLYRSCWRHFLFYSSVHLAQLQDWQSLPRRRFLNPISIFDISVCIQVWPDDWWLHAEGVARWLSLISHMLWLTDATVANMYFVLYGDSMCQPCIPRPGRLIQCYRHCLPSPTTTPRPQDCSVCVYFGRVRGQGNLCWR